MPISLCFNSHGTYCGYAAACLLFFIYANIKYCIFSAKEREMCFGRRLYLTIKRSVMDKSGLKWEEGGGGGMSSGSRNFFKFPKL